MVKVGTVVVGQGLLPEGHHVFKVDSIDASKYEDFGKLTINLITQDGHTHQERFTMIKQDGTLNEGAQKAWSFWVGTILDRWGVGETDTDELVGKYLAADVEHVESDTINEKTGKPYVNARLNNMTSATGFDGATTSDTDASDSVDDGDDLDDL